MNSCASPQKRCRLRTLAWQPIQKRAYWLRQRLESKPPQTQAARAPEVSVSVLAIYKLEISSCADITPLTVLVAEPKGDVGCRREGQCQDCLQQSHLAAYISAMQHVYTRLSKAASSLSKWGRGCAAKWRRCRLALAKTCMNTTAASACWIDPTVMLCRQATPTTVRTAAERERHFGGCCRVLSSCSSGGLLLQGISETSGATSAHDSRPDATVILVLLDSQKQ
jgi:hypothetical protein